MRFALTEIPIAALRFYQKFISPLKGKPTCRFYPSCSQYAISAYRTWGLIGGTGLTVWRVLRCQPFCRGGFDPVPPGCGRPKRRKRGDFIPHGKPTSDLFCRFDRTE